MIKLANLISDNLERLAEIESQNNGIPYETTLNMFVGPIVPTYKYFAGLADTISGRTLPLDGPNFGCTLKEAVGVVGAIIPWNYPLAMQCWKLGPALMAGCCVVMKLSEKTPLTGLMFCDLLKEAGFPKGVVNVVNGKGNVGEYIARHMDIDKIAFTGSAITGKRIVKMSAESNLKKVSLELGGKSPLIICKDANLEKAVEIAHFGNFFNSGQVCCASTRI